MKSRAQLIKTGDSRSYIHSKHDNEEKLTTTFSAFSDSAFVENLIIFKALSVVFSLI